LIFIEKLQEYGKPLNSQTCTFLILVTISSLKNKTLQCVIWTHMVKICVRLCS